MRCKKCGAKLRDNDVFCPQCGWRVERENRYPRQETLDIPIADIEQNIIETTEKELGGIVRPDAKNSLKRDYAEKYTEKEYDDDLEEDKDYDDIDDEENVDEGDAGNRLMTIMIAGMAFLILAMAVFAGFRIVQKIPIRNYGKGQEHLADEEDGSGSQDGEGGDIVGMIVIQSNVNVRDYPSTEGSQVLKVAQAGERYEYFGMSEDGSWYIVALENGEMAYIFKDYALTE